MQSRFNALWREALDADNAAPAWRALNTGYGEPHRAYHNWSHIEAMLTGLDEARALPEFDGVPFDEVALAIFFHDTVYDPRAQDNEERSAALFRDLCSADASNRNHIEPVAEMIIATAVHAATSDPATRLLLDLDLRVLGGAAEQYAAYARAVRAEYSFVPEQAWRDGRSAVLKRFLERDRIFQTNYFSGKHEAQARTNIAAEIEALAEN